MDREVALSMDREVPMSMRMPHLARSAPATPPGQVAGTGPPLCDSDAPCSQGVDWRRWCAPPVGATAR